MTRIVAAWYLLSIFIYFQSYNKLIILFFMAWQYPYKTRQYMLPRNPDIQQEYQKILDNKYLE